MTAIALFGFSTSTSFWMLCLWAIPYGLGAGSVDASLNNYVAVHYATPIWSNRQQHKYSIVTSIFSNYIDTYGNNA